MSDEKKSRYTEAQAKAAKKYLKESVEDIRIRVPKGDKAKVQEHAATMGESMNSFVVRAIDETRSRDIGDNPSSTNPMLSLDVLKTAENAAETSGETVPQFIKRAVNAQSERDKTSFRIGLNPVTGEMIRNNANSK